MNKDTQIFITGATGFTGSYVTRTLLKEGFTNLTAIKRASSSFDLLDGLENLINWVEASLEDHDILDEALQGMDVIIHTAAIVNFKGKDKRAVYECNVNMVHDLVNLALKNNIRKFVHFSSIAALGRAGDGEMVDENTEWVDSPLNSDYGKSKYQGEMEVWRAAAEGLDVVILNPSLIMGAGFWHNTTPAIYKEVDRGHRYYPLGSNGMVDVRDVAKAAVLALDDKIVNERFLLNADNISYYKMFSTIAKHINAIEPTKPLTKTLHKLMTNGTRLLELLPFNLPFSSQQLQVLNSLSNYNASKSVEQLGMDYLPVEKTLVETAKIYKEAKAEAKPFGILPLI